MNHPDAEFRSWLLQNYNVVDKKQAMRKSSSKSKLGKMKQTSILSERAGAEKTLAEMKYLAAGPI